MWVKISKKSIFWNKQGMKSKDKYDQQKSANRADKVTFK